MERFKISIEKADESKIVSNKDYRITVISDRLFRVEIGKFCDNPTQAVISRNWGRPQFSVVQKKCGAVIETEYVKFSYDNVLKTVKIFDKVKNKNLSDRGNLKGTVRTLDFRLGAVKLPDGLMAKGGVSIYDDSKSLALNEDGTLFKRSGEDYYIFAYGDDYIGCLKDFFSLTGYPPLLPKYALSNWWSRYYPYSEESYLALMKKFKEEKVPITVATVDMDWHIVSDVPKEYKASNPLQGAGWTGYTWNEKLFPDYKRFLKSLHDMGLAVTLNLHPRDGVRAFEAPYEEMAKANGIDPATKKTVEFDLTDKKFLESYFDVLHRPYEKDGVNFWWIDWQQGTKSKMKGLDPLWALNHYHFLDSKANGDGLILSRYAGIGSHRYPLGFSGDCIVAWKSLKFQPYFTVTASNVGYTWWSHDIGGHIFGKGDDELYLRWLQFGVFSSINRLHSSSGDFTGKEPWLYRRDVAETAEEFLRLRHSLLPYINTANYLTHAQGTPLMTPMYYKHKDKAAYKVKNEYYFGSEIIVNPITSKIRAPFNRAGVKTYLPDGVWIDLFTGDRYKGAKTLKLWRKTSGIPVLLKEGAIVPTLTDGTQNKLDYEDLTVYVTPGNNSYTLIDEKGKIEYKQTYQNGKAELEIVSDLKGLKSHRVKFVGIESALVKADSKSVDLNGIVLDGGSHRITLEEIKEKVAKDFKERLIDIMQDYHIFIPLRHLLFKSIKKADTVEKARAAVKRSLLRCDVKSAMLEALEIF